MEFKVDDRVEFLCSDGVWRPGVVVSRFRVFEHPVIGRNLLTKRYSKRVRIRTGPGVCIIRPAVRVRLARPLLQPGAA